jgi:hypothetical protein
MFSLGELSPGVFGWSASGSIFFGSYISVRIALLHF